MKYRVYINWLVLVVLMMGSPHLGATQELMPQDSTKQIEIDSSNRDSIQTAAKKSDSIVVGTKGTDFIENNLDEEVNNPNDEPAQESKFTSLHAIIGGILLLSGLLIGYLIAYLIGQNELKKLRKEHSEIRAENENLSKELSDVTAVPVSVTPAPKTIETKDKPAPYNPDNLLKSLSGAVLNIEQSIAGADSTSRITQNIQRAMAGLSEQYPGIKRTLKNWETNNEKGSLTLDKIYHDLNVGEMRKSLATLYALSGYTKLKGVSDYFSEKGIDHKAFVAAVAKIFSALKTEAKLDFQLPEFGESYNEHKYSLIDKNYGMIYDIDSLSIVNIMRETTPDNLDRPIIDVEQIGLPDPPKETAVTFSYPAKAVVGFLPIQ